MFPHFIKYLSNKINKILHCGDVLKLLALYPALAVYFFFSPECEVSAVKAFLNVTRF